MRDSLNVGFEFTPVQSPLIWLPAMRSDEQKENTIFSKASPCLGSGYHPQAR